MMSAVFSLVERYRLRVYKGAMRETSSQSFESRGARGEVRHRYIYIYIYTRRDTLYTT